MTRYEIEIDTESGFALNKYEKEKLATVIFHLLEDYRKVGGDLKYYDNRILDCVHIAPDKVTQFGNIHFGETREWG